MTEQAFTYETDCDATWTTKRSRPVQPPQDETHTATCHGLAVTVWRLTHGTVQTSVRGRFGDRTLSVYAAPDARLTDDELRADAIAFAADLRSRGMEPIR